MKINDVRVIAYESHTPMNDEVGEELKIDELKREKMDKTETKVYMKHNDRK